MGSYKWRYLSRNIGYKYSSPTYSPTYNFSWTCPHRTRIDPSKEPYKPYLKYPWTSRASNRPRGPRGFVKSSRILMGLNGRRRERERCMLALSLSIYICIHVYIYMYTCNLMCMYVCMYAYTCIYIYSVCMYMYMYLHCVYVCTHIYRLILIHLTPFVFHTVISAWGIWRGRWWWCCWG